MFLIRLLSLLVVIRLASSQQRSTIQWTNAGGNPLWEEPRNWDLLRVPTANDDVIINLYNIPADVRIGAVPAQARTLTIGGSSNFGQTLTVQGSLTIGGGKILPNGNLFLNSAPGNPFFSTGVFDAGSKLQFISGSLSGPGSFQFTSLNMSGPAFKQINSTVIVSSLLAVDPGAGGNSVIAIVGGILSVNGYFRTSSPLTVSSSEGGSLSVPGSFIFQASSASYSATIRGKAAFNQLSVAGGSVILNDNVNVMTASVAAAGTLNLVGSGDATRKFGDINGPGKLSIQGGTNSFSTMSGIGDIEISGGSLVLNDRPATANTLSQKGGLIQGPAPLTVSTAAFGNCQISGTTITASFLNILGFVSLTSANITVVQNGVVSQPSQITMSDGAVFWVGSQALVAQSAAFSLLPASSNPPSVFVNWGQWTSTSTFQIVVPTMGTGIFQLASGSITSVTGVSFAANSLVLTSSTFSCVGSTVLLSTVAGSGIINSQGDSFTVTTSIQASSFTHCNGITKIASGSIGTLDVQTGTFNVTGPSQGAAPILSVQKFLFEGGFVVSPASTNNVMVNEMHLTGTQPKTFSDITVTPNLLTLDCDSAQCQVFTVNAHINAGKKIVKRNGIPL